MEHRIHLLRHAPLLNVAGIAYGRDAGIDRTPSADFRRLANNLPRCAVWIMTDYPRTLATAEELKAVGAQVSGFWPPQKRNAFVEQNWGSWVGQQHAVLWQDPVFTKIFRHEPGWADATPPLGESFNTLVQRVGDGLEALVTEFSMRELVVVSHGGTLRAALVHAGWGDTDKVIATPAPFLSQLILTHDLKRKQRWQVEKLP